MTEPSHAVFLSYASQDQEAAQRICEALRAAAIEVWFDQSALRGGDVWDQTIRKQIKNCVAFIPVISRHTHDRDEGYFRLEWKLAVDRSYLMTADKAFLLPVAIDDTREDDERVPDRFREVHWTRLPHGETPPAFVERIRRLVSQPSHDPATAVPPAVPESSATPSMRERVTAFQWPRRPLLAIVAVVLSGALVYFTISRFWVSSHPSSPPTLPAASARVSAPAFAPPPHSIAVLPFVNMSGDASQEYFSDGLTEELLNSLARINELQVVARTSSFSFKGRNTDIGKIARELNVGAVLEGSVRRSRHTIRVTAQLNDAITGFHLWSETYDRDLGDILKLQTDIAKAVANALKVRLLGDVAGKMGVGGTRDPEAFDAYLRALRAYFTWRTPEDVQHAIAGYTEAIRRDPRYALAYAARSVANRYVSDEFAKGAAVGGYAEKASADARAAISLAPDLAEGHLALAHLLAASQEFKQASQEYDRAIALAQGNARALSQYGFFAAAMGHTEAGIAAARRSVVLDPLNSNNQFWLGVTLVSARHYNEAIATFEEANLVAPNSPYLNAWLSYAYYKSGNFESARVACGNESQYSKFLCMALLFEKRGQRADAQAMLAKAQAVQGDTPAVFYAVIYAEGGDYATALDWLETAMRQRSPDLVWLKAIEAFDPLRKEPRLRAIERELTFPD